MTKLRHVTMSFSWAAGTNKDCTMMDAGPRSQRSISFLSRASIGPDVDQGSSVELQLQVWPVTHAEVVVGSGWLMCLDIE